MIAAADQKLGGALRGFELRMVLLDSDGQQLPEEVDRFCWQQRRCTTNIFHWQPLYNISRMPLGAAHS
jgi:hypothetical protein